MECGPRYDFGTVLRQSGAKNMAEFARRVGVHHRQVVRWAHEGLTHRAADRVSCRLGWLPYAVWPEWLGMESSETVTDWIVAHRPRAMASA